ncbi:MAG: flagellar protein FlaG [Acidobacteria bacterium]|nr:MAG: flagellar protein FlaG [Acidobacteriota bacterium]
MTADSLTFEGRIAAGTPVPGSGPSPPAVRPEPPAAPPPRAAETAGDRPPVPADAPQFLEDLKRQLAEIQARGSLRQLRLDYEIRDGNVVVVKILDAETDKVIRTVPPEEQLELARRLEEYLGLVLDETA